MFQISLRPSSGLGARLQALAGQMARPAPGGAPEPLARSVQAAAEADPEGPIARVFAAGAAKAAALGRHAGSTAAAAPSAHLAFNQLMGIE